MTLLWTLIGVLLVIVWIITIVDVVRRRLGAARTSAWLLIVLLLPFAGAVLYWALRPADETQRRAELERETRSRTQPPPFDSTHLG